MEADEVDETCVQAKGESNSAEIHEANSNATFTSQFWQALLPFEAGSLKIHEVIVCSSEMI